MWTEELKNGKFKYVERYEHPITHEMKKASLTHTKNNKRVEKEMFIKLQKKIDKKINKIINVQSEYNKMTLKDLTDEWLDVYKETVKLSSYSRVKSNLNSLNKSIGNMPVDQLKASHINHYFLTRLQNKSYKHNTVNQLKSNISRVLKFGQTYRGIQTESIVEALEVPKLNMTEKNKHNYLEPAELKQIITWFSERNQHELKRMVVLQANTGMRFGEMVSLDYKTDIDFSESSITINKTYDFINNTFTSPKTGDERVIYFNDAIARLLKEQIAYTQSLTMSKGLPKENTQLFKTIHGNMIQHRVLNDKFKIIDLDKKVTTHTLRHTFVTMAVEKGMNKDLIAKQVGHSDTKMIDEIYSHFTDGMQKQQKEAMLDFKII